MYVCVDECVCVRLVFICLCVGVSVCIDECVCVLMCVSSSVYVSVSVSPCVCLSICVHFMGWLHFLISSKGSFIYTIPQTEQ